MKKRILRITLFVAITMLVTFITCKVNAGQSILSAGKAFVNKTSALQQSNVVKELQPVANVLLSIAVIVFLGVGLMLGITFMTKGPDEKAKVKERFIWYIISMVFVFGAITIYNIAASVYNNVMS